MTLLKFYMELMEVVSQPNQAINKSQVDKTNLQHQQKDLALKQQILTKQKDISNLKSQITPKQ